MPDTDITSATIGNFDGTIVDYQVTPKSIEGAQDQKETFYDQTNWTKWFGYYKVVDELAAAIDAKARWTIGKGFTSNSITELLLISIVGWGKDSFNTVLENMVRVYHIGGDAFAEIIRDDESYLINLKPLNPEYMRTVVNQMGIIIRYEQLDRRTKRTVKTFRPDQIFHLSRNRVADQIHGTSMIEAVEETIIALQEAYQDYRKLLHRNVYPIKWIEVDTDDTTEISAYKVKIDQAFTQGENIIVPKGATMPPVVVGTPANSTLNPLPWIAKLEAKFYKGSGVPQIIVGGSEEITEASAKIAYLAWEQTVEEEQLYIEEQVLAQLNLEIELTFPASLQNEMLSSKAKEETMQASTPEDTAVQGTELNQQQPPAEPEMMQ